MSLELLLLILAILGGIDLAGRGLRVLSGTFPIVLTAKASLWNAVSTRVAVRQFSRYAISSRMDEVLNQTVNNLSPYLPKGWVRRAKIEWVVSAERAARHQNSIIIKVKPGSHRDHNLMRALWVYFDDSLFPTNRDLIPDHVRRGIALAVTRAGIEANHSYLLEEFDAGFVTSVLGFDQESSALFADCVRLNEYGLLMGPFIRELDSMANYARFGPDRFAIPSRIGEIRDHMLSFQPMLRTGKPTADWRLKNSCTAYGFILVSRPPEYRPGIEAYVKRARENISDGVDRIYLIGRKEEKDFVQSVVASILTLRELKGLELFHLFRDYRGDRDGVGALLAVDHLLAELGLIRRGQIEPAELTPTPDEIISEVPQSKNGELFELVQADLASKVEEIIVRLSDYEGAWIDLAEFGGELRRVVPSFTPQRYGQKNLASVLRLLPTLEFFERDLGPNVVKYVRMKQNGTEIKNGTASSIISSRAQAGLLIDVVNKNATEDGWLFLGRLGHLLKLNSIHIDQALFGASSLHDVISSIPEMEIEERGEGHSKTYVRVRT